MNTENKVELIVEETFETNLSQFNIDEIMQNYNTIFNLTDDESSDTDDSASITEFANLLQLDEDLNNKNVKQLGLICEYYSINKSKLKKQEIVDQIIIFEINTENKELVKRRQSIWSIMDKLKNDPIMKKYIIWDGGI
jgi:hypothetical protein